MSRTSLLRMAAALSAMATAVALAAPTPEQLARLGNELTPVGAERAGNAAGTIPPWTGGLPAKPIDEAVGYVDPFADDKILFTISAANADQYRDQLSPGQLALLALYPETFRINVYPTRRSAAWPQAVLDQVKKQAPLARTEGDRLLDVGKSAVPFPIPDEARQLMWNHVLRWRGGSVNRTFTWFPVAANGRFFTVRVNDYFAFDQQGFMNESRPNRLFNLRGTYLAPTAIEGQMTLVWEPIDPVAHNRDTWAFDTRWQRVRRLPSLSHDDVDPRTQGMRLSDQYDGWNGAPDRYDWKIAGKREMYIQYNAYKLSDKTLRYRDIIEPGHPKPELLRYELHRVWVVEATLRPGARHRYPKRTFYLDEDTWQVVGEDAYNAAGQLWRVGDHATMQFYDVMVPWYRATIHYDLLARSYLISFLDNEERQPWRFGWIGDMVDFLPSNLRRLGTR